MRILFLALSLALVSAPAFAADLKAEMQALEHARNQAIAADDETALAGIYASDFSGIAAGGAEVDRATLFRVFKRAHDSGALRADSTVLSARMVGEVAIVTGRLKLTAPDTGKLVSDSLYMHVFRKDGDAWHMVAGAATPVPGG